MRFETLCQSFSCLKVQHPAGHAVTFRTIQAALDEGKTLQLDPSLKPVVQEVGLNFDGTIIYRTHSVALSTRALLARQELLLFEVAAEVEVSINGELVVEQLPHFIFQKLLATINKCTISG